MAWCLAVVLVLGGAATAGAGPDGWLETYERALGRFALGDQRGAHRLLEEALAAHPQEALAVAAGDGEVVDYLPHLYLAITAYHGGELDAARSHLAAAERSGVSASSATGRVLLDHYRDLVLAGAQAEHAPAPQQLAGLRAAARAPERLSPEEVQRLVGDTLERCGLPGESDVGRAPWYFHYLMGLELEERGDPQRAVDYLLAAVERRPLPSESARMYGMWFTRYRPYLEIARSHANLGNWRCAYSALQVSASTGEASAADEEGRATYLQLLEECQARLSATPPEQ